MKNYAQLTKILYDYIDEEISFNIQKMPNYPDEPQIYRYGARLNNINAFSDGREVDTTASGYSFESSDFALLKCFMEAIERWSMLCYREKNLLYKAYNQIEDSALDPNLYRQNQNLREERLGWLKGFDLLEEKKVFIPAQTIFYNYLHKDNEMFLTTQVSTGAAAGFDYPTTVLRSIYEIIERDSFMTFYLANIKPTRIDTDKIRDTKIKEIIRRIKRYNLEVFLFDFSSDLTIPTFLACIIDRTGLGQSVSLGLKSSLDYKKAVIGCLEEAVFIRSWMRSEMVLQGKNDFHIKAQNIHTIRERGLYWLSPKMIEYFSMWVQQDASQLNEQNFILSPHEELEKVKENLKNRKLQVFCVDIAPIKFKQLGGHIYKVVIPKLQPIYFDEKYPEIHMYRLREVAEFFKKGDIQVNKIPHPFL